MLSALALTCGLLQPGFAAAQMTGDPPHDAAVVDAALAATLEATARPQPEAARLAMEELYRLWRVFRRMDFDAPQEKALVPELEAVEAQLWAASLKIDAGDLTHAHGDLEAARTLLGKVRGHGTP